MQRQFRILEWDCFWIRRYVSSQTRIFNFILAAVFLFQKSGEVVGAKKMHKAEK